MNDFVVRPFAFMRLTHEALRAGFSDVQTAAAAGDIDAARTEFDALRGVIEIHAKQEEQVFFPLLDELFEEVVTKAGLFDAHDREEQHFVAVESALADGDLERVVAELDRWTSSFERHLVEEEDVMMPLTQRVSDTLEGRAAAVREIMESDWEGLRLNHLPYVVAALSRNKAYGPLRMFVSAVQVSSGDRFGELEEVIRSSVTAEQESMLKQHGHLS